MINREKTRLYKDLFNLIFSIVNAENMSENGKAFYAALQQYDQLARATATFMAIHKAQFTWDVDNIKQEYEGILSTPPSKFRKSTFKKNNSNYGFFQFLRSGAKVLEKEGPIVPTLTMFNETTVYNILSAYDQAVVDAMSEIYEKKLFGIGEGDDTNIKTTIEPVRKGQEKAGEDSKDNYMDIGHSGTLMDLNFQELGKNKLSFFSFGDGKVDANIALEILKQEIEKGDTKTQIQVENFRINGIPVGRIADSYYYARKTQQLLPNRMQAPWENPTTSLDGAYLWYNKMYRTNSTRQEMQSKEFYKADEGQHPFSKFPDFWVYYKNSVDGDKQRFKEK
jgi:hypothetical protein